MKLSELSTLEISSHTGNRERRKYIRDTWNPEDLVIAHNFLVNRILDTDYNPGVDRDLLLSMEQEGINTGGKFYGKIKEEPHGKNISYRAGSIGTWETGGVRDLCGSTNLYVWRLTD